MQVIFAVASLLAVAEAWSSPSTTCEVKKEKKRTTCEVKASMVSSALLQSQELTIAQKANRLPSARSSSTRAPTHTSSHISKFRKCKITRPTPSQFDYLWEIFVAKGTGWIHIFKNGGSSVKMALKRPDMNTTFYSGNSEASVATVGLQDLFLATVVQDPLHRALSGLHETLKRKYCEEVPCAPHPKSKSEWVAEFRLYVQNYLHGTQDGDEGHMLSQASSLAGVDGVKYPMDYIGDLANLEEEVKSAFHLEALNLTDLHGPQDQPDTLDPNLFRLEVKDLPDDLVKLACEAYRDDYCCFDFSIPETCDIDC